MLNELKAYKNLDVYVTGSNSKGLSKDIASVFRGRATQIHVFPLSFEEFYSHVGGDERKALDTYMLYGGMPRLLALTDEKDKKVTCPLCTASCMSRISWSATVSSVRIF